MKLTPKKHIKWQIQTNIFGSNWTWIQKPVSFAVKLTTQKVINRNWKHFSHSEIANDRNCHDFDKQFTGQCKWGYGQFYRFLLHSAYNCLLARNSCTTETLFLECSQLLCVSWQWKSRQLIGWHTFQLQRLSNTNVKTIIIKQISLGLLQRMFHFFFFAWGIWLLGIQACTSIFVERFCSCSICFHAFILGFCLF